MIRKVRDRKLVSTYGQRVLDSGFYTIPNLLLDAQKKLGISNAELVFYIKVTHFFQRIYLGDDDLEMPVSKRTLRTVRKSLVEKGYLAYEVKRFRGDDGKISRVVIKYDWSGLIASLNDLQCGKNFRLYNEDHAEKISGASLYGKESAVKESSKQAAFLKNALTKRGLKDEVAEDLCNRFEHGWIEKKIEACDRLGDKIKTPAGWLRKAIEANDGEVEQEPEREKVDFRARYEAIKEAVKRGEDPVIYDN